MLPSHASRMRPAVEQIIRDQVLDLVAVSLTNVMGQTGQDCHQVSRLS
jgi:hypothetical protein